MQTKDQEIIKAIDCLIAKGFVTVYKYDSNKQLVYPTEYGELHFLALQSSSTEYDN
jgi:hypothetical protein